MSTCFRRKRRDATDYTWLRYGTIRNLDITEIGRYYVRPMNGK
jgi:hypothetical protein